MMEKLKNIYGAHPIPWTLGIIALVIAIGALIFNKSMMETYNLEAPYQAVKEGKWTMDLFQTYLKAAGFTRIEVYGDRKFEAPGAGEQRMYFKARKGRIK